MKIRGGEVRMVGVSERTVWVFVVIEDDLGNRGVGEASLDGYESQVEGFAHELLGKLGGREVRAVSELVADAGLGGGPGGLPFAAALSATDQALWDLWGQRLGVPVHALMGAPAPSPIPLYANINRALLGPRGPTDFAKVAADAVEAGFQCVKCSPFDGVLRAQIEEPETRTLVRQGLERLRAVREAIGDEIGLIVDCHFRFTARSFLRVSDELAEFQPYWVEGAVAEHRLDEWAQIRAGTTLRLAGGELLTGYATYERFLDATGVDVAMPDVKYVGGVTGLRVIAHAALSRDVLVAPHNPSGPVSTLATAHCVCNLSNLLILEYAFGECDWRQALVSGAEQLEKGLLRVPAAPGFGVVLDDAVVSANPRRPVRGLDLRTYR
jgi:galactonate dehydratase